MQHTFNSRFQTFSFANIEQIKLFVTVIFILSFCPHNITAQNIQPYYNAYSNVVTQTGILFNKGFIYPNAIRPFLIDANPRILITNPRLWKDNYRLIKISNSNGNFHLPPVSDFYSEPEITDPEVKIGGFYIDGDYIDPNIINQYFDNGTNKVRANVPKKTINIASVANLRASVGTNEVTFKFDTAFFFTNRPNSKILGFSIDYDDGNSPIYYPFGNFESHIQYPSFGVKKLLFTLYTATDIILNYSNLTIVPNYSFTNTVFKDIAVNLPGGGIQEGFYSKDLSCDGNLDKPVIIVEGFDSLDKIDSIGSQQKYYNAGLLSYFLEYGYDVIGLQFKKNNDYLQNNAKVVQKLLETINQEKIGNYENIIIGESNGGINTRIALAEMEANNIDHEVGLYISFDSPHAGVNIPLGLQELAYDSRDLDFTTTPMLTVFGGLTGGFAGLLIDAFGGALVDKFGLFLEDDDKKIIEANNSPVARQQIIRHREYPNYNINPEYYSSQEALKQVGYPNECRKITLINGSDTAKGQDSKYPDKIVDIFDFDYFLIDGSGYATISPIDTPFCKVSAIESSALFGLFDLLSETGEFSFNYKTPYDVAPGGITENDRIKKNYAFALTASTIDLAESVKNTSYGPEIEDDGLFYYNESSTDPKRKKRYIVENHLSPFDDIYGGPDNTGHISFDAIGEIVERVNRQELMFDSLFLQNRTFTNGKKRDFHAFSIVQVGRNVNSSPFPGKEIAKVDFVVQSGAEVHMTAGNIIEFLPGTIVETGAFLEASIYKDIDSCQSFFSGSSKVYKKIVPVPIIEKTYTKISNESNQITFRAKNQFQDALPSEYLWTLVGNGVSEQATGYTFSYDNIKVGNYCIICSLFDGERMSTKYFEINEGESNNTVVLRHSQMNLVDTTVARIAPNPDGFSISPNPANEILRVNFEGLENEPELIFITDLLGRKVWQMQKPSSSQLDIPLEGLKNDVYFITITSTSKPPISKRFIKRK